MIKDKIVLESLIDLSEEEASQIIKKAGLMVRIGQRDDEIMFLTNDFICNRLNLFLRNNKVFKIEVG